MKEDNIFKNAKFGDRFKTKNGREVIFFYEDTYGYICIMEGETTLCAYHSNGEWVYPYAPDFSIVSRLEHKTGNNISLDDIDKILKLNEKYHNYSQEECNYGKKLEFIKDNLWI